MAITQRKLPARLIWIGATVFLLVLVVHFAGIALLRYFVEQTLHPALPKGTYLGEVHLNLLTGSLDVDDFELRRDGELRMRLGELKVAISPWRLLTGQVHVRKAVVSNAYLRVDRLPDGGFDLGLPPFGGGAADAQAGPPPVSLAGVLLERVAIDYWDGELGTVLYANRLELGPYDARAAQQQVPVDWDLEWDGRPLRGSAQVALAAGEIGVEGRLETGLLDVGLARELARADHAVRGELGGELAFDWNGRRLRLNGDLNAPAIEYLSDPMVASLEGLTLPGLALELEIEPNPAVRLVLGSDSAVERLAWRDAGQAADLAGLSLGGRFGYSAATGVAADQLLIDLVQAAWQDGERKAAIDRLQLRGAGSLPAGTHLPLAQLDLAAGRVVLDDATARLSVVLDEPRLGGFGLAAAEGASAHRLSGSLAIGPVRVEQADTSLRLGSVDARLAGLVGESLQLGGDLDLDALELSHPALPAPPLRVAGLSAKGLGWDGTGRFDRLELRDINLPALLEETSLRIAGVALSEARYAADSGVSLGSVVVDGLQTGVIRDPSGTWRHVMSGPGAPAAEPVAAGASEPAAPAQGEVQGEADAGLAWSLGEFRVTGDSHITGADHLNPDMQPGRFFVKRFEVGALSTARPDSDTPFDIVLQPDRYSDITLQGLARPLAEKRFIEVEGHIQAFGMRSLNGLVGRDLGHRFLEGELDNDFKLTIDTRQLEMNNSLLLHRLEVEELEGQEGPPLATAIALLEDTDGNIKLEVPISGNLDDPQFRVLGALNPIIMKAVAGTAALAIQPLGSVLLVGGLLASEALKVSFEPALFAPGSSELDGSTRKQLSQLAGKLAEKPKLALRICGVAAETERRRDKEGKYLDQESDVLELAQRRAETARSHLLAQGVGEKQLRSCRPAIDQAPEAKPRVDIRL